MTLKHIKMSTFNFLAILPELCMETFSYLYKGARGGLSMSCRMLQQEIDHKY